MHTACIMSQQPRTTAEHETPHARDIPILVLPHHAHAHACVHAAHHCITSTNQCCPCMCRCMSMQGWRGVMSLLTWMLMDGMCDMLMLILMLMHPSSVLVTLPLSTLIDHTYKRQTQTHTHTHTHTHTTRTRTEIGQPRILAYIHADSRHRHRHRHKTHTTRYNTEQTQTETDIGHTDIQIDIQTQK